MSNMTGWFPPHIKPEHKGVYEIKFDPWPAYAQWNGNEWSHPSHYKIDGYWHNCYDDAKQTRSWRGFTKEQT
jgi:hypothetical protein